MNRRGSAVVETALAAPVASFLLLGVLEWGWYFELQSTVVHVALDAAGAGSRALTASNPNGVAWARGHDALADAGLDSGGAVVLVTTGTATAGATLTVTVTVPYEPLTGLIPVPSHLRAAATVRKVAE